MVSRMRAPPSLVARPKITGSAMIFNTLTCDGGRWRGHPAVAVSWQRLLRRGWITVGRGWVRRLTLLDMHRAVRCSVTASNGGEQLVAVSNRVKVRGDSLAGD